MGVCKTVIRCFESESFELVVNKSLSGHFVSIVDLMIPVVGEMVSDCGSQVVCVRCVRHVTCTMNKEKKASIL